MTIGDRIRDARKREGLTQGQLAERMGTSQSLVSQYEHNLKTPGVDVIARFAAAIGCDFIDLVEWKPTEGASHYNPEEDDLITELEHTLHDLESLSDKDKSKHISDNLKWALRFLKDKRECEISDPDYATNEADRAYRLLNDAGREKLVSYAADLLLLSKYRKTSDTK